MAAANDHCKLQRPATVNFGHVETFHCLINRVVVSETSSTADSFQCNCMATFIDYIVKSLDL